MNKNRIDKILKQLLNGKSPKNKLIKNKKGEYINCAPMRRITRAINKLVKELS